MPTPLATYLCSERPQFQFLLPAPAPANIITARATTNQASNLADTNHPAFYFVPFLVLSCPLLSRLRRNLGPPWSYYSLYPRHSGFFFGLTRHHPTLPPTDRPVYLSHFLSETPCPPLSIHIHKSRPQHMGRRHLLLLRRHTYCNL